MRGSHPRTRFVAVGRLMAAAPDARRWNGDGPIVLAETRGHIEIGEPMSVTCVCGETIEVDPQVRSVPLDRFDDELLESVGLTLSRWGWKGNLGLDGIAHVIEHRNHTVAAITAFGEFQPGRDIWAHHGVVEITEAAAHRPPGEWRDSLMAIAALLAVLAGFVWLNAAAIGGYVASGELERSGIRATAEVIDVRRSGGPRQADVFAVTYSYTDTNGKTHIAASYVDRSRYQLASIGGTIDIAYDPNDSSTSAVIDNDRPVTLLGITIVIDVVVVGLIVAGLRSSRRQAGDR